MLPAGRNQRRVHHQQRQQQQHVVVSFIGRSSPPKRSLGKPALSKVPLLEIVNGDSDYTGTAHFTACSLSRRARTALGIENALKIETLRANVSSPVPRQGNGSQAGDDDAELEPLELVWAKCRGYPSYPALVLHPPAPCHSASQYTLSAASKHIYHIQ